MACIPVMSDEYGSRMIRVSVMFDLDPDTCLSVCIACEQARHRKLYLVDSPIIRQITDVF